jgi:trans-aconitate 2-methyltransferase
MLEGYPEYRRLLLLNKEETIMGDWNPDQYLKFKNERTQPSMDLVSRIKIEKADFIIDIGCGPGNSTQILRQKWPSSQIVGIDRSEEMIKKAREDYPDQKWFTADAASFKSDLLYDIVFSNAVLQWIPHHEILVPTLFKLVQSKGALAVQIPANQESPLHKALLSVSLNDPWHRYTEGCEKLFHYQSSDYYYNLLAPLATEIEQWETTYYHILPSHQGLIEWYKGTGMRPFLDRIPGAVSKMKFENEVLEKCKDNYKIQNNGKILYPFNRIFFIAYR